MSIISPKFAKGLTTAIVRRANKYYPPPGIVGVYGFNGQHYSNKADLRVAVGDFCATLTYEQAALFRKQNELI